MQIGAAISLILFNIEKYIYLHAHAHKYRKYICMCDYICVAYMHTYIVGCYSKSSALSLNLH